MQATKVKAHVRLSQVVNGEHSLANYLGNGLADVFAGASAYLSSESEVVQCYARRHSALCYSICVRIAFVEGQIAATHEVEREWQLLLAAEPLAFSSASICVQQLIDSKGHIVYNSRPGKYRCKLCHKEKSFANSNCWLKSM